MVIIAQEEQKIQSTPKTQGQSFLPQKALEVYKLIETLDALTLTEHFKLEKKLPEPPSKSYDYW